MRHSILTLAAVLLVTGCAGTSGTGAEPQDTATDTRTTSPTATRSNEAAPTNTCPNPYGGVCLGTLAADRRYQTSAFEPQLSYEVPDDSWANMEDLPGNFWLYRPRDSQDGVLGGSYIGIYQNAQAPDLDCLEQPAQGVGDTPEALIDFYQSVPGLQVSKPEKVTIGGLSGYQLDFAVRRADALCNFSGLPSTPLIIGNGVSDLHHVVAPGLGVRLVLLRWKDGNVTVEITHVDEQYTAAQWRSLTRPVLRSLEFG